MLQAFFHAWERRLADGTKDRVVRPFEWGLDWIPENGHGRAEQTAAGRLLLRRRGVSLSIRGIYKLTSRFVFHTCLQGAGPHPQPDAVFTRRRSRARRGCSSRLSEAMESERYAVGDLPVGALKSIEKQAPHGSIRVSSARGARRCGRLTLHRPPRCSSTNATIELVDALTGRRAATARPRQPLRQPRRPSRSLRPRLACCR